MTNTIEYMGYEIRRLGPDSFAVIKDEKCVANCLTEYDARGWINRYRKLLSNNTRLRQVDPDTVRKTVDTKAKEKSNIVLLAGPNEEKAAGEKYIKITSRKNKTPEIDVGNLDPNEVLGLMKRAEYIITNHILRNGSI